MAKVKCKYCGEEVSEWSGACQQCKKFWPTSGKKQYVLVSIIGGLISLFVTTAIIGGNTQDGLTVTDETSNARYLTMDGKTLSEWNIANDEDRVAAADYWAWVFLGKPDRSDQREVDELGKFLKECVDAMEIDDPSFKASDAASGCWAYYDGF